MLGGYYMINCSGLDLTDSEEQEITGIYEQVKTAHESDKLCLAFNCMWGEGKICSPVPVIVINYSEGVYTATSSTLQLVITSADKVTVNNLVA